MMSAEKIVAVGAFLDGDGVNSPPPLWKRNPNLHCVRGERGVGGTSEMCAPSHKNRV